MMENAFYYFAEDPDQGHSELITFLLEHDAHVNIRMLCRILGRVFDCHWTTQSRAEFWRQFEILLSHCAVEDESEKQLPLVSRLIDLSAQGSIIEHVIALGFAVEYGDYRKEFAIPLSRDRDDPPLMMAVYSGRFDLAKKLIAYGANVHSWCWHDQNDLAYRHSIPGPRTVLEAACRCAGWDKDEDQAGFAEQSLEFVDYLLQMNVQVNCSTKEPGMPALHHAALRGRLDIACKLLDHGADVNALAISVPLMTSRRRHGYALGARALDLAAFEGRVEMVQLLIDAGGRSGTLGSTGLDGAVKLATESHHTGVVELLKSYDQRLRGECDGLNDDYLADVKGMGKDGGDSDWGPNTSEEYPYLTQDTGSDCEDLATWWE
ncbi:ankyrin repeat-containing domain protein [Nemania diffusa]|nr:ankyrin repeat-containing domain protein [Nemania diffusa]